VGPAASYSTVQGSGARVGRNVPAFCGACCIHIQSNYVLNCTGVMWGQLHTYSE